ncbi:DUF504 domain-containing protein [Chitinispirillales bacterium ANBcel5]|uniref:DUF504 domain-containing protein n=1 Tax=Cellulosispirillum alkaliphilum TaxID=3039283 RepID=UPI002A536BBC|nr:DUF504 domain-containing protein [Chitinispirillales bacterium ANBcel5]
MEPVKKILDRIIWDRDFSADATFVLMYEDRRMGLVSIGLEMIERLDPLSFTARDQEDRTFTVPLHRIRRVYRNGELIWKRG